MARVLIGLSRRSARFLGNTKGAVAVETALVAGLLTILIAQVLDFGWFAYSSMQVKSAAQAAAAKAAAVCKEETQLPATVNCDPGNLTQVLEDAAQQITNSSKIAVTEVAENYYCEDPDNSNSLVIVGDLANEIKPADCSPYSSTAVPSDFISVTVTYDFSPLFPGLSAVSFSGDTLTAQGWMRLE